MNARLAVEKLVELKVSFLDQAKSNAERHNRDLFVEIERLKKSFFKMYSLSDSIIEELVSEVLSELNSVEEIEGQKTECKLYSQKRISVKHNGELIRGWKFTYAVQFDATTQSTEIEMEIWVDDKKKALAEFKDYFRVL